MIPNAFFFFAFGILCGLAWPQAMGSVVVGGALISIAAAGYVERSPDAVFDLLDDYYENIVFYTFLPWAAGALLGALWCAMGA